MAGFIEETVLQDILNRTNIVEVIGECIPLKRAGRNFKALCPFHREKTPSFVVSADKQIYHCFGCGAGGNVFQFLMEYERLEFPEVVEQLAQRCGVTLPAKRPRDAKAASLVSSLYAVNELARAFYTSVLFSQQGARARSYLAGRGITAEAAKLFKLGFAPDGWDALIEHAREKNISLALLEKAGLVVPKDTGGFYDRFRNRVIFPIFDVRSSCIGFGARVMDSVLPKYINSPETAVYKKGCTLYGLGAAKDAIKEADRVVVVEGYLDGIIPFQHGIRNIVASLGTALTPDQARLIRRYTSNVVMVYDPDPAGELATIRSLDIFIEEGMQVSVACLPNGYDPDSLVRAQGVEALASLIQNAQHLFDYKLKVLETRHNADEPEGKAKIAAEMLPTIRKFKNAILRSEYLKRLADHLRVDESALAQELAAVKDAPRWTDDQVSSRRASSAPATEKLLMKLMLEETQLVASLKDRITPADFENHEIAQVVATMFELVTQGKECQTSSLIQHLGQDSLSALVCESAFMPDVTLADKEKILDDCVMRLKKNRLQARRKHIQEAIRRAEQDGNHEQVQHLQHEFLKLIKSGQE